MILLVILSAIFASACLIGFVFMNTGSNAWARHSAEFTQTAGDNLERMFMFTDTRKLLMVYACTLVLVPVILYIMDFSLVFVFLSFVVVYQFPKLYFKRLAKKRADAIVQALPDTLAQISGSMRAGSTFISAVQSMVEEQKGPISQEFSLLLREQRLGARLEEALDNLGERVQTEDMDLVISAALISQDVGGNLAEIFARLSNTLRRKIEMEGRIKALTAQGVMQGYVVTALPFLILAALLVIEPDAMQPMLTGILGWSVLALILILQIIGGTMIKKIVSVDV